MPVGTIASDSSLAERGDSLFLTGVAIEIVDLPAFENHYFAVLEDFCRNWKLDFVFPVIKARDLASRIPSYRIREAHDELLNHLLNTKTIKNIHCTIGYFDKNVDLFGKTISGIEFCKKHLSQYFALVPLWRLHQLNRAYLTTNYAQIDGIQGQITKVWKYVGIEFETYIIPHGDVTYPALSLADLTASFLAKILPRDRPFREYGGIAISALKGRAPGFVDGDVVNEANADHLVPDFPYALQEYQHYPHPVTFVYDDVFEDKSALEETDFYGYLRKQALEEGGCVSNLSLSRHSTIIRSGDRIVYTPESDIKSVRQLVALNPTKAIEMLSASEVVKGMQTARTS